MATPAPRRRYVLYARADSLTPLSREDANQLLEWLAQKYANAEVVDLTGDTPGPDPRGMGPGLRDLLLHVRERGVNRLIVRSHEHLIGATVRGVVGAFAETLGALYAAGVTFQCLDSPFQNVPGPDTEKAAKGAAKLDWLRSLATSTSDHARAQSRVAALTARAGDGKRGGAPRQCRRCEHSRKTHGKLEQPDGSIQYGRCGVPRCPCTGYLSERVRISPSAVGTEPDHAESVAPVERPERDVPAGPVDQHG